MDAESLNLVLRLLDECKDLTLATVRSDGAPQANIVNFAHEQLELYFATDRSSQKVRNIQDCARVSLALRADYEDWRGVQGLSIAALAEILPDDGIEALRARECLTRRFVDAFDTPSPQDPATTVYVKLTPTQITLIDYSKGYGHRATFRVPEAS